MDFVSNFNRYQKSLFFYFLTLFFGIIGLFSPFAHLFILTTPIQILLTFILIFYHKRILTNYIYHFILIGILGFITEVIGTNTGYLFGGYSYGPILGINIFKTPILMIVLWSSTIYLGYNLGQMLFNNKIIISLISALSVTLLDIFIEPVAVWMNMWNWDNNVVPLYNYICWFVISFILTCFLSFSYNGRTDKFALYVLIGQYVFFIILNIGLWSGILI